MHIKTVNQTAQNPDENKAETDFFASDIIGDYGTLPKRRDFSKSLYCNPLDFLSLLRISVKKSVKRFLTSIGESMPFQIRHEKSFCVVSFAGFQFQVTHAFGAALELHQKAFKRKKKMISRLFYISRKRRAENRELKTRLHKSECRNAYYEQVISGLKRRSNWARRNNG